MFIILFFIVFMVTLDNVKDNKFAAARIYWDNFINIESEITIENKVISKQWFF